MSVLTAPKPVAASRDPVRVMVVDDSAVVRGLVTRWLQEEADLAVVSSLRTGREAVDHVERADPDVVILDVEMPDLDGISALPLLLAKRPGVAVIMASALTRRHAEISLKALSLGATDYVPKPESNRSITTSADFRRELVEKVRQLGRRASGRRRLGDDRMAPPAPRFARSMLADAGQTSPAPAIKLAARASSTRPRVLLIGASTGGPQALSTVVADLHPVIDRFPVLIVQHMPPTFTTILAEHLTRISRRPVREPQDGEAIVPGVIHLAPGGRHMLVDRHDGQAVVRLDDGPPVNFCKPAVDPLFVSASRMWAGASLALILTGMGHDGAVGARAIASAGGIVVCQDEATSVVWGMPGSTINTGVCSAVLPIGEIAPKLVRIFAGEVS